MGRFNSKSFRVNNHFVLYDCSDNLVGYFDNYDDLSRIISKKIQHLVELFNKVGSSEEIINIVIDNTKYKLFTFVDEEEN